MTGEAAPPRFDLANFFDFARKIGHGRALGLDYCDSGDNWAELSLPWREQLVGKPDSIGGTMSRSRLCTWIRRG